MLKDSDQPKILQLVVASNKSDSTIGWKDAEAPPAVKLFFIHHSDAGRFQNLFFFLKKFLRTAKLSKVYDEAHALELSGTFES